MSLFVENQENGAERFRAGGLGAGCGGGAATALFEGPGLFEGDSAEGDQAIDGRAFVMLLRDRVLLAWSFSGGIGGATKILV